MRDANYGPETASAYEYEIGDRVDYAFWPQTGQGTPGTVSARGTHLHTGAREYQVVWDDGFSEDQSFDNANWWPETELVRWEP